MSAKKKKKEYFIWPLQPVGRSANAKSFSFNISGNAVSRAKNPFKTDEGILGRCMACNHEAPIDGFLSDGKYTGCPECYSTDKDTTLLITPEGTALMSDLSFSMFENGAIQIREINYNGKPRAPVHSPKTAQMEVFANNFVLQKTPKTGLSLKKLI